MSKAKPPSAEQELLLWLADADTKQGRAIAALLADYERLKADRERLDAMIASGYFGPGWYFRSSYLYRNHDARHRFEGSPRPLRREEGAYRCRMKGR